MALAANNIISEDETDTKIAHLFIVKNKNQPLHTCVREAIANYFSKLKGEEPTNLYQLILAEVEPSLLEMVMAHVKGNQSKAAIMLGLSRGTFRKLLKKYRYLD